MSKVLNTSDSYDIINRKEILADSNTSAIGSLNTAISNPAQKDDGAYLLSRVGNAGNTDRKPAPGYCLHFDSVNVIASAPVFIQTNIPSVERSNYNIVIKGEGTIDLLQVDTSDTNIRIVPKQAITDSAYFDLSYIAFRNITTGKIDHLFECEESSGMLLYDAVTGDTATITSSSGNIVSLTTLRGVTSYKEWITDEDENLKNSIKCNSTYGQISTLKSVPAEVSLCITIKITQEEYDPIGPINILGMINGTSYFCLSKRPENYWMPGFTWSYKNANLAEESGFEIKLGYYSGVMSDILDGKPHKLVCCIGDRTKEDLPVISDYSDKGLKFFLDGVAVNDRIGGRNKQFLNVPTEFNATNTFGIGTNTNYTLNGGCTISNVKYFNFDISTTGAPYTLDDYQNGKDVPENLLGTQTASSTDSNMGVASVRTDDTTKTGWEGIGDTSTLSAVTKITCGDWTVNLQPNHSETGITYIDNYSLTDDEKATIGANYAVALTTKNYIGFSATPGFLYNSTKHLFPTPITNDSIVYKLPFKTYYRVSAWVKPLQTGELRIGIGYYAILRTYTSSDLNTWQKVDAFYFMDPSAGGNTTYGGHWKAGISYNNSPNLNQAGVAIANVKVELVNSILSLNNVSNTLWVDSSANNWNMTLAGTYKLPNKNYGTWCNGVGYTESDEVKLPRKIINNNILSVTDIVATTSNAEALTTKTGEILSLK